MTKQELIELATYKGNLIIDRGYRGKVIFDDLTHYFDDEMLEIGYTSETINPDVPVIFNPRRIWGKEAIASHLIKRLWKWKEGHKDEGGNHHA